MRISIALVLPACALLMHACKHEIPVPNPTGGGEIIHTETCHPDTVYFQQDILPMLVAACGISGCHDAGTAEDDIVIDSWTNLIYSDDNDLVVNPMKAKQLTNIRAAGSDENILLTPPIRLTLEQALELIDDDELVEVTPSSIRVRKKLLKEHERKRASRAGA